MRIFDSLDQLRAQTQSVIGVSDWVSVTQERIQAFADITGDQQWIHTDPERARRESRWGTTIAHGYLTLSLIPQLNQQIMRVDGAKASVNYGLDKLRFPAPVPVGARIRSHLTLLALVNQGEGRYLARYTTCVEIEGDERPACVAENLVMYIA